MFEFEFYNNEIDDRDILPDARGIVDAIYYAFDYLTEYYPHPRRLWDVEITKIDRDGWAVASWNVTDLINTMRLTGATLSRAELLKAAPRLRVKI